MNRGACPQSTETDARSTGDFSRNYNEFKRNRNGEIVGSRGAVALAIAGFVASGLLAFEYAGQVRGKPVWLICFEGRRYLPRDFFGSTDGTQLLILLEKLGFAPFRRGFARDAVLCELANAQREAEQ